MNIRGKWHTSKLLPVIGVISILALLCSAAAGASFFSFPAFNTDGLNFKFGTQEDTSQPGTVTKVEKYGLPFDGLSEVSGMSTPFNGFSPFYRPYTMHKSYSTTTAGPEGPVTKIVDVTYDGKTGEKVTTITNE